MDKYGRIFVATSAGILASAIGVELAGYLAAIAVPEDYFLWFRENLSLSIGLGLLYAVHSILGFGLLLLAAGYFAARHLSLSSIVAIPCLLVGFWLYLIIGVALVYGGPISSPIPTLNIHALITVVIHMLCLVLGVALGKKYNHAMHATSA